MTWTVRIAKSAQKAVAKFPAKDQQRIGAAISEMATDPFLGDVLKLEGSPQRYRRRVGSYRIFFTVQVDGKIISVSAIVRRTSTTY